MGITWREAIANIAFSLLFAILPLVQPQLALNTVYPPVGCPHWGICANNTYDPSYTTYYQCFPNFCVCNDGTTDDLTLTETYYYDELTTQPPSFQRCATVSDVYAGCYAYSDINSKADCNTTISAQPTVDSCRTIFQNSLLNIDSSDTYYCVMGNECGVCEQNPFAGKTLYNDSACNQPCGTEANYNTTKGSGKSKTTTTSWGLYSYKG
ncbi:unnamed protein product, partial [Mesorhabditis belari]|uniref:Uncharacterized protein n=1 Tax=Mesorhabditis belari TaxID=2138241 RepID=A0AAF3FB84_9BILA